MALLLAVLMFGLFGAATAGLVISRSPLKEMWARTQALLLVAVVLTILGIFGFWIAGIVFTNVEHPSLQTCQDYPLPPASMAKAVAANADPNSDAVSETYTVCRSVQQP